MNDMILLVEDDEALAQLVQLLLERAGYTVKAAGNGDGGTTDLTLRNLAKFAANFVWNLVHPTTSLDAASFEKLEIIEEEVEKIIPSNL